MRRRADATARAIEERADPRPVLRLVPAHADEERVLRHQLLRVETMLRDGYSADEVERALSEDDPAGTGQAVS